MAKTKVKVRDYYEVYGDEVNVSTCEGGDGNKYTKWKVEEAYRSVCDARKALEDSKMRKYVGMCAKVKAKEAADAAKEAGVVAKVGAKLKEVLNDY